MTELVQHQIIYSDVNQQADLQPFDIVTNIDEAVQRVLLVLATPKGSRWKRYKFGSLVSTYLFDPLDNTTATKIRHEIEDCLTDPENDLQDIVISDIEVIPDYTNQQYYVNMRVDIPNLQDGKRVEIGLRSL